MKKKINKILKRAMTLNQRKFFVRNCLIENPYWEDRIQCITLYEMLYKSYYSFFWRYTKEGINYWHHILDCRKFTHKELCLRLDGKTLHDKVYDYHTESKYGFNPEELAKIVLDYPNMDMEKYSEALTGITCMSNERGETIIYRCDVLKAIRCGIEKRNLTTQEWD